MKRKIMYDLEIKPKADKIFSKLAKKNPKQLMIIGKKIKEIRKNKFQIHIRSNIST